MDRSCIILKDMNAQYHDLNCVVRLIRLQMLGFTTEFGHLRSR